MTHLSSLHVERARRHTRAVWEAEGARILPLAELATAAGVSSGHRSREFQRAFGVGPSAALAAVRLGRAAIALQRSNLSIADVANESGFANAYHFSRRFSRFLRGVPGGDTAAGSAETTIPSSPSLPQGP